MFEALFIVAVLLNLVLLALALFGLPGRHGTEEYTLVSRPALDAPSIDCDAASARNKPRREK